MNRSARTFPLHDVIIGTEKKRPVNSSLCYGLSPSYTYSCQDQLDLGLRISYLVAHVALVDYESLNISKKIQLFFESHQFVTKNG